MIKSLLLIGTVAFSMQSFAQSYSITWKKGSSQIQTMSGGKMLVPTKLPLRQSIRVQSRESSDLLLVDGKENILYIAPNSDVSLLIPEKFGAPLEVRIHTGEVYLNLDNSKRPLKISTLFGNWSLSQGMIDFKYDDAKAKLNIFSYRGNFEFKINDAEDGVSLKTAQKIEFAGERNEEGIVFNFLLAGKKIAQGQWGKIQKTSAKDIKEREKFWSQLEAIQKQIVQKQVREEKSKESKYLCTKPSGQLNQCVWTCQNNPKSEKKICRVNLESVQCVRRRCFADGEWKESMTLDRGEASIRCKAQAVVGNCE